MEEYSEVFVGLDIAKVRHAVAVAEAGRVASRSVWKLPLAAPPVGGP